jgi:hypothetical protein
MKKRKPPIILITVVILCAAIAFAFNSATSSSQDPQQPQQPQAPPVQGTDKPRPANATSKSIAATVKQQSGPTAGGPGGPGKMGMHGPGGVMLRPGQLSIEVPKNNYSYKPTPNDSATSSQWYQKESARGNP